MMHYIHFIHIYIILYNVLILYTLLKMQMLQKIDKPQEHYNYLQERLYCLLECQYSVSFVCTVSNRVVILNQE